MTTPHPVKAAAPDSGSPGTGGLGAPIPDGPAPDGSDTSPPARLPSLRPGSWAFWRLRLARALMVGGIAIAAVRLAPALPREQQLVFEAPAGATFVALDLTWRNQDDQGLAGGVELRPNAKTHRLTYRIEVPNGEYTLSIAARVHRACGTAPCQHDAAGTPRSAGSASETEGSPPHLIRLERIVALEGDTTRLTLTDH